MSLHFLPSIHIIYHAFLIVDPISRTFSLSNSIAPRVASSSPRLLPPLSLSPAVMSTLSPKEIAHQKAHIHDDRSTELYGAQITCFLLAVIAVALRLISRRLIKAKLMADDYMILFALVCGDAVPYHDDLC